MLEFREFFSGLIRREPYPWQRSLAENQQIGSKLIRIPTGFGKTLGVAAAWLYNRVERGDESWPRRLVWCLPMRTLVEQTVAELSSLVSGYGIRVHTLMGGADAGEWDLAPEENIVLVGTQDMLLSRALNRGYGAPRARWPMHFGLLNRDCLWVMDEVQLMDVGLATSSQLQAFRLSWDSQLQASCYTWWMSATLQADWLESVDSKDLIEALRREPVTIRTEDRFGGFWEIHKSARVIEASDAKGIAALAFQAHSDSMAGEHGRITLVVLNTVKLANEVFGLIEKLARGTNTELRLVHSRFRGVERASWRNEFLSRQACTPDSNRIIVATQVVEAGVDTTATTLLTELAPWPCLVQRFGRAARYGGQAAVCVLDRGYKDDKAALPYSLAELDAARDALSTVSNVGIAQIETFEERCPPDLLKSLYPYDPLHLLVSREAEELFDTSPDLSGADIDISRFIRSGNERDVQVFWRQIPPKAVPSNELAPEKQELCAVPIGDARDWLKKQAMPTRRCWVWDYVDESWRVCRADDLYPGQTLLVGLEIGGYDSRLGWTGKKDHKPTPIQLSLVEPSVWDKSDASHQNDALSAGSWRTIAEHGLDVATVLEGIVDHCGLPPELSSILIKAGLWHDIGKAHPAFVSCIRLDADGHPGRIDLAKAPDSAWKAKTDPGRYVVDETDKRRGFRHELASALGLFAILQRHDPDHPALLGVHREILEALGHESVVQTEGIASTEAEDEILSMDSLSFDLLTYLVCAHHGKVRAALHVTPMDQEYRVRDDRGVPIAGVREGDHINSFEMMTTGGSRTVIPPLELTLDPALIGLSRKTGLSWSDRVGRLLATFGPFTLSYLEALLRAADIRASRGLAAPARRKDAQESQEGQI